MTSVMLSVMKHLWCSMPAQSCTPKIPNMKKTKKHMSSTLPSIGSVSNSSITNILKSASREIEALKQSTHLLPTLPLCHGNIWTVSQSFARRDWLRLVSKAIQLLPVTLNSKQRGRINNLLLMFIPYVAAKTHAVPIDGSL